MLDDLDLDDPTDDDLSEVVEESDDDLFDDEDDEVDYTRYDAIDDRYEGSGPPSWSCYA